MKINLYHSDRLETKTGETSEETTNDRDIEIECEDGAAGLQLAEQLFLILITGE